LIHPASKFIKNNALRGNTVLAFPLRALHHLVVAVPAAARRKHAYPEANANGKAPPSAGLFHLHESILS